MAFEWPEREPAKVAVAEKDAAPGFRARAATDDPSPAEDEPAPAANGGARWPRVRVPRLARVRLPHLPRPTIPRWAHSGLGRITVVAAGVVLVAGLGAGVAALISSSGPDLTKRDRSEIEAAAPGILKKGKTTIPAPKAVRRIADSMPLARQVAQLFVVDLQGQYPRDPFFRHLRRRDWGGVVIGPANYVDDGQLRALTGEARVVARQAGHVLPLVAANQSGGAVSAFPGLPPKGQNEIGKAGRPALARAQARAAGLALRRRGVTVNFAPVADVGSPAGPVEDVVFGDSPALVTRLTKAAVAGYTAGRVIPAVGHFPGIGSASEDPDTANATVGLSLAELRARDLRPFAAIASVAPVIVVSNAVYAAYDGVSPAVELSEIVGGLLRRDLGFKGVVMTSDLNSTAPVLGWSTGRAAVGAIQAGADLLYVSGTPAQQERAFQAVLGAARKGTISRERLRLSVLRVLALKRRFGVIPAAVPRAPKPKAKPKPKGKAKAKSKAKAKAKPKATKTTPAKTTPATAAPGSSRPG